MISKSLGSSRRFRRLLEAAGELGEFAQALYALVVAHADDFGRQDGDAFTIKHEVFPTSKRTEEEFEAALVAMEAADLIRRHRFADDKVVLQVDKFEEHQPGLHKRTASKFQEVPGKPRKPQESHASRARVELNRTELNLTEGNQSKSVSSELAHSRPSEPTDTPSPVALEFPTVGTKGQFWALTEAQVTEWQQAYPSMDILAEAQKALTWVRANPGRRKTAGGMARFLVSWLNRANDRRPADASRKQAGPAAVSSWRDTCRERGHSPLCGTPEMCRLKAIRGAA